MTFPIHFYLKLHLINLNITMQHWDWILCSLGFFGVFFVYNFEVNFEVGGSLSHHISGTYYFINACQLFVKLKNILLDRRAQFCPIFVKLFFYCCSSGREEDALTPAINKHFISGRNWTAFLTETLLTAWHFRFLSLDTKNPITVRMHLWLLSCCPQYKGSTALQFIVGKQLFLT